MLILTRKPGESLYIGDTVKVTIVEIKGNQIRVGIDAPRDLRIYREEIYRQILEENKSAAGVGGSELEGLPMWPSMKAPGSPGAAGEAAKAGLAKFNAPGGIASSLSAGKPAAAPQVSGGQGDSGEGQSSTGAKPSVSPLKGGAFTTRRAVSSGGGSGGVEVTTRRKKRRKKDGFDEGESDDGEFEGQGQREGSGEDE